MDASPSHSRIRHLLELVELHEQAGTAFPVTSVHDDADTAWAELKHLDRMALAKLSARSDDGGALRAELTPFGRGTLALVRGEA